MAKKKTKIRMNEVGERETCKKGKQKGNITTEDAKRNQGECKKQHNRKNGVKE